MDAVRTAVGRQDGRQLASLLRVDDDDVLRAVGDALRQNRKLNVGILCQQKLPPPFDELLATHCQCLASLSEDKCDDAYTALVQTLVTFIREFRQTEQDWLVPPMQSLAFNCRVVAERADRELGKAGKKAERLNDAGSQLMKCFSAAQQGMGNKAKRLACLAVVNQSFKIYFRLNTLRLCKNLIRAVEAPNFVPLEHFPIAQQVTYKFFTGRLAVFDEDYAKAASDLSFAFARCHRRAKKNKQLILQYLIPVNLLLGRLPRASLLQQHELTQYLGIVEAVRTGNVRLLNNALDEHQDHFIRSGTYLLLEKLKAGVYRTLFMRVHLLWKQKYPGDMDKPFKLGLQLFQAALAFVGVEMELDEVECIVANLIYRKYIKGYLSHKSRVIVLSKAQPFPKLSTVFLHDPA